MRGSDRQPRKRHAMKPPSGNSWGARREAQWLGLLPGWAGAGACFPQERYAEYARGLRRRVVAFEGPGSPDEPLRLLAESTRQAFLAALEHPERAPELLAHVVDAPAPPPQRFVETHRLAPRWRGTE